MATINLDNISDELATEIQAVIDKHGSQNKPDPKALAMGLGGSGTTRFVFGLRRERYRRQGNLFYGSTKEEVEAKAQAERDRRAARQRIEDYIDANGLRFEPDWKNRSQIKYQICGWDYELNRPNITDTILDIGGIVFCYEWERQQVLDACADDLRIVFKRAK